MRHNRPLVFIVLAAVLILAGGLLVRTGLPPGLPSGPPSGQPILIAVLDVGQADSIFVRSPTGQTMLVDAGNSSDDASRVVIPFLREHGVNSLDYLLLTHPDQDHVGGMPALLEQLPVGTFLDSRQETTNRTYLRTLELLASKGVPARTLRQGRAPPDLGPEVQVQVLWPPDPLLDGRAASTNNNSVVLRIRYNVVAVLLPGDIEREAEERLVSTAGDLSSQIMKAPHHGSRTSSSETLLRAVRPEVVVISAGRNNRFGHPHPETLGRLEAHGIVIHRTDINGTVIITSDGNRYTVTAEQ